MPNQRETRDKMILLEEQHHDRVAEDGRNNKIQITGFNPLLVRK